MWKTIWIWRITASRSAIGLRVSGRILVEETNWEYLRGSGA